MTHTTLDFSTPMCCATPADDSGTPLKAVEFALERHGMTRADLTALMGGRPRVSECVGGKRRLSIAQIQRRECASASSAGFVRSGKLEHLDETFGV